MSTRLARLRQEIAALLPGTTTHTARRVFHALGHQAITLYDRLDTTHPAQSRTRARILSDLAATETAMADAYAAGWSTQDDGTTYPAELVASAELLHLIASTEAAEGAYSRVPARAEWETAFGFVLDQLAHEIDLHTRAELMTRLYLHAYAVLGVGINETVTRVGNAYIRAAINSPANGSEVAAR